MIVLGRKHEFTCDQHFPDVLSQEQTVVYGIACRNMGSRTEATAFFQVSCSMSHRKVINIRSGGVCSQHWVEHTPPSHELGLLLPDSTCAAAWDSHADLRRSGLRGPGALELVLMCIACINFRCRSLKQGLQCHPIEAHPCQGDTLVMRFVM